MQALIDSFGEIAKVSKEAETLFLSTVVTKDFKAKTILQKEGIVANEVYFVEKGITRTFYYKDGKDITHWIALEKDIVGSVASFFSRKPSKKYVETLEDCHLWVLDYEKLEKVYAMSQELERMGRLLSNYAVTLLEQRFDDLHFMTAKERYEKLLQRHPEITQRVSLGIIASYLGITQETLSRIRHQV